MTLTSDTASAKAPAIRKPAGVKVQKVIAPQGAAALPAEVEFIMSALDAGNYGSADRRQAARFTYRVSAALRLYSDVPNGVPGQIFVKEVNAKGLGFLTRHRLPLGYGGILTIPSPLGGSPIKIDCTLLRCREAVQGWFEGSMYFNREQGMFEVGE